MGVEENLAYGIKFVFERQILGIKAWKMGSRKNINWLMKVLFRHNWLENCSLSDIKVGSTNKETATICKGLKEFLSHRIEREQHTTLKCSHLLLAICKNKSHCQNWCICFESPILRLSM
eukprot:XP_024455943.1 uncharacterized protein LOC112327361 isoform X2 [Populus trichocarpa]